MKKEVKPTRRKTDEQTLRAYDIQISGGDAMKDDEKTREQFAIELKELRLRNAKLEKSITRSKSAKLVDKKTLLAAESIVETIREPLLVLDKDLKIISANHNFYRVFKVTPGETIGSSIYDLGNKQWDIPKLRTLLEKIILKHEAFFDFEVVHNFRGIGHKIMLLNARQIYRKDIAKKLILVAIEDITEHKRLEDLLKESEFIFRRTYETANDAILLLEKREGKIARANTATEKMLGYTQEESIGKILQDIGVKLDIGDLQKIMQTLDKDGIIHYKNVPIRTKSGQRMDADIYLVNKSSLLQCNIRDITESKRAKDLLEETNRALVGRELRMIELKERIAELEKEKK
jgi:PAS domain S-box-containing protein